MKRVTKFFGGTALLLLLAGCGNTQAETNEEAAADKALSLGFNSGPYRDQFEQGIAPILEEQGYTFTYTEFSDGLTVNQGLDDGEIHANIMQHPVYMNSVNEERAFQNRVLVQVPTPPMGLYSEKHTESEVPVKGATVSVPNQPSNFYRAARVLKSLGWIDLPEEVAPASFDIQDIKENPYDLEFVELDNAQQVTSLPDVDYALIQGNFAISSGLGLDTALSLEQPSDEFLVVAAVKEANLESEWAKAIIAAYQSEAFQEFIQETAEYEGYMLPEYFE